MSSADLGAGLLKAVSRSFYLSVRVLPAAVREPIGLAYLLARASDTIADSSNIPADIRARHLASFDRMIQTADHAGRAQLQEQIRPEHAGERQLIARLGECLQWLHSIDENDRTEIQKVLADIIRGQALDLQRFGDQRAGVRALKNASELEEYTYLVAGCVGSFWTRICLLHLDNFTTIPAEELLRIGTDFGKGLQLVNILRDLPADLRDGRCYLPADELGEVGVSARELETRPEAARPIFNRWLERADTLLDGGRRYVKAIRPARVRIACFLPWYIGRETLELIRATPPLETPTRIKVPRRTIRTALCRGMIAAISNYPVRDRR